MKKENLFFLFLILCLLFLADSSGWTMNRTEDFIPGEVQVAPTPTRVRVNSRATRPALKKKPLISSPTSPAKPGSLPAFLVCDGEKGLFRVIGKEGRRIPIFAGSGIRDVQPQKDGSYLVTGGPGIVSLLEKEGKSWRQAWTWEELNLPCVENAVAAEWNWNGRPSKIFVSDCTTNRLFLASAESKKSRIRWEMSMPAPPQRVSLCGDSGRLLLSLRVDPRSQGLGEPPQVAEIDWKDSEVVWSLDSKDGLTRTQDAVRDRKGRTYVVAGKKAELFCFDIEKKLLWQTPLKRTSDAKYSLSLFGAGAAEKLLVCARPSSNKVEKDRVKGVLGIYGVDLSTGAILFFEKDAAGDWRAPSNLVPDESLHVKPRRRS